MANLWYRSLYWRIAFGFIALLATLLLAQGLLFFWLTDRFVSSSPARTPAQLAEIIADDIAAELTQHPQGSIETYVSTNFRRYQPFVVALTDGRRASNRPSMLPPGLERGVQERLRRSLMGYGTGTESSWVRRLRGSGSGCSASAPRSWRS